MLSALKAPSSTIPPSNPKPEHDEQLKRLLDDLHAINLSEDIFDETPYLKALGSYCDVFQAKSRRHDDVVVAVKRLRVHIFYDKDVSKTIFRELSVWSALKHPNVLPLLGYVMHGEYPALVSIWMKKGSLRNYMESHPDTSKKNMLKGIAEGLAYLHSQDDIHADLKSANILISDSGDPLLADFGISRVMTSSTITTSTMNTMGSARWMAIELLRSTLDENDGECRHTRQTDIWAFGMVAYELLTGLLPYDRLKNDLQVSIAIAEGKLPSKPEPLKDADERLLWSICKECWAKKPSARPDIASINKRLSGIRAFQRGGGGPLPTGGGFVGSWYAYDSDSDDTSPRANGTRSHQPDISLDGHYYDYDGQESDFADGFAPETSQLGSEHEAIYEWNRGNPLTHSRWEVDPGFGDLGDGSLDPVDGLGSFARDEAGQGGGAFDVERRGENHAPQCGSTPPSQWESRAETSYYEHDPLSKSDASHTMQHGQEKLSTQETDHDLYSSIGPQAPDVEANYEPWSDSLGYSYDDSGYDLSYDSPGYASSGGGGGDSDYDYYDDY